MPLCAVSQLYQRQFDSFATSKRPSRKEYHLIARIVNRIAELLGLPIVIVLWNVLTFEIRFGEHEKVECPQIPERASDRSHTEISHASQSHLKIT